MLDCQLLTELVILGLATWRLSSFLVNEQGPAGLCERFRSFLGISYNKAGEKIAKNWLASELTCQWCFSLYIGILFGLMYLIVPKTAFYVALPLALSTINILVMTSKGIQVYLRHLND